MVCLLKMKYDLTYLEHADIDLAKWDACIRQAHNSLIYAQSSYLDLMASNWNGIILGNYEAVMPLPWRKKYGIGYLYQPAFTQQGGVFSNHQVPGDLVEAFLRLAYQKFAFAEIALNYANPVVQESFYTPVYRNNYVAALQQQNQTGSLGDENYIQKRIRRSQKNNLQYTSSSNIQQAITIYKTLYHDRMFLHPVDYLNFQKLCTAPPAGIEIITRHVYDENEKLLAIALLLKDEYRIYNLLSCLLPEGKKLLANYFLYNAVMEEFKDTNLLFDFEGSDEAGIAFFYKKFSATNQPYPYIKFNRLPTFIQLFKK